MRLGRIYHSSSGCLSTCQTTLAVTSSPDAERTQGRFEKLQPQCHTPTITNSDAVYHALGIKIRNLNSSHRDRIESTYVAMSWRAPPDDARLPFLVVFLDAPRSCSLRSFTSTREASQLK